MKKNYKRFTAFLILLGALSIPMAAALSGVYTINSGSGTSGTNFQTFNAFAAAINSQGVSGAVTVDVVTGTGPYNEQVLFSQITGASAINKITINGNNCLLTYNSTNFNSPATLSFNGADWFTINNLKIMASGSNYAHALQLYGTANNNTYNSCTFSTTPNGTSSGQIPVVVNGGAGQYYYTGTVNNNNTWQGCQMFGGYFSFIFYGDGYSQWHSGNQILNCKLEDFYQYGLYSYSAGKMIIKGNEISRKTRTNLTGCYAMLIYTTNGGVIVDGNKIHKLNETQPNGYNSLYGGIYFDDYVDPKPSGWVRHVVKNNIISDIKGNGDHTGMTFYYTDVDVFHNTISFDDPNSTSGWIYGAIYYYGQSGINQTNFKGNLISMTRGGTDDRYGFYLDTDDGATIDNNDIYTPGGSNDYVGYVSGNYHNTLSSWQSAGYDLNGYDLDPSFVSVQNDLHPTNSSLNNKAQIHGVLFDQENMVRHATTPDIGALEFLTPACSGAPAQTITGPNYSLCPGETANFIVGNLSSDLGWTYKWQYSTISNVGTWTIPPGETGIQYSHMNVQQTTWVSVVITCTVAGGQSTTVVKQVDVAGVTTNTAPYFENFDNIGVNDRLPNCSWLSPQLGSTARTYIQAGPGNLIPKSGTSFASFNNSTPGTGYYYTNKIYMYQGITYSASVWYQTDLTGGTNWSNLSILYGNAQTSAGLTSIASTGGPAISPFYKPLSNTFKVPASGYYYVAIRATSAAGNAQNLSFDDLRIEIPCSLNSPTVSVSVNNATICAGEAVVLTASGADNYLWSNGEVTSAITVSPQISTTYTVNGSSALSGCGVNVVQNIEVNPSPVVVAIASSPSVCSGKSVILTAGGAQSYAWSNGGFGTNIKVTPTGPNNTTLQVIGTNEYNCTTIANVVIGVYPNPNVSASVNNNLICSGDGVVFTGAGASSYSWLTSNNFNLSGNPVTAIPPATGTYTLTGTDNNGCTGTAMVSVAVEPCTGLKTVNAIGAIRVFPNPTSGEFTVEMNSTEAKVIQVTDVTGRVIQSGSTDEGTFNVNINQFTGGVYYVKVTSMNGTTVIKVIKQ